MKESGRFKITSRFWPWLKLAALSLLTSLLVLLILASVLVYSRRERITELFINSLNHHLESPVMVDRINLEMIRSFPLISVELQGVNIQGHYPCEQISDQAALATLSRISFQFSLWDVFRGRYQIRQAVLSDGFVHICLKQGGQANYHIWASHDQAASQGFSFALDQVMLRNISFSLHDEVSGFYMKLNTSSSRISGDFSQTAMDMSARGRFESFSARMHEKVYFSEVPAELSLRARLYSLKQLQISQSVIKIDGFPLSLTGSLLFDKPGLGFDAKVSATAWTIEKMLPYFPESWQQELLRWQIRAQLTLDASINGQWNSEELPAINLNASLSRGSLLHRDSGIRFRSVMVQANYHKPDKSPLSRADLEINEFSARSDQSRFKGSIRLANLANPLLTLHAEGHADMTELIRLWPGGPFEQARGDAAFQFNFQGRIPSTYRPQRSDLLAATTRGTLDINRVAFQLMNKPLVYKDVSGSFVFQNNDLLVESLSGMAGQSDFSMQGYFRNALSATLLKNEKIIIQTSLRSHRLDLEELINYGASGNDKSTENTFELRFPPGLSFQLETQIDSFSFRKFKARNIRGQASMHEQGFAVSDIRMDAVGGSIQADGYIDGSQPYGFRFACDARLSGTDIRELFYQMGNFAQQSLTDKHLSGELDAVIQVSAQMSNALDIDWQSLRSTADLSIKNGSIESYQPIMGLSGFLRTDALSHVRFATLENRIDIRDKLITIPRMEIRSNALNLDLSGQHSFENEIRYQIRLGLAELLNRRNRPARNPQDQYGDIQDDGLGKTQLFLLVSGTVENPVFSYDHQGVREKLREDLREEGRDLREALRQEFRFLSPARNANGDSLSKREKEMKQLREQEKGKFIFEWDEF